MSWIPLPEGSGGGYALAMNRDELRTRAPAAAPSRRDLAGVWALLPTDGEAGGSWISVNAFAHSLALLNRWEDGPSDPGEEFVSRGLLLLELATEPDALGVEAALRGRSLTRYRPFTLASVTPDRTPRLFEWTGRELAIAETGAPGLLRTSSGFDQEAAERVRGRLFREATLRPGGLTPEVLVELHRSHLPERGPLSICMHRPEAVTVSFALITASDRAVTFRYVNGAPGESDHVTELSLPRTSTP